MNTKVLTSRLALGCGAVIFALLLFAIVEGCLRILGVSQPDGSKLRYQEIRLPLMSPDVRPDGVEVFRTNDPRLWPDSITQKKLDGEFRVFVLGGSAAAGLGYSPNVTFSTYLERMLEQSLVGRTPRLVNLGITALSSAQVKLIAKDVIDRFQPDLLVIYSGNNEFLEIHAEKYVWEHGDIPSKLRLLLSDLHLFHFLNRPKSPEVLGPSGLHLTQREILKDISLDDQEVADVINNYEQNLRDLTLYATKHNVPVLLLTVGSNWKWRGRDDLPSDWLDELVPPKEQGDHGWGKAVAELDRLLQDDDIDNRHELYFRRAVAHEEMGRFEMARTDYIAAMNTDPHLRRTLDEMNKRVLSVAVEQDVYFLDLVELLSRQAENRIVGFDEFYDYVHFTPRGALQTAAGIHETLREAALVPIRDEFFVEDFVLEKTQSLQKQEIDSLNVDEWIGFCRDREMLSDRDLWKYDKMLESLNESLAENNDDFELLVFRGNFHFFQNRRESIEQAVRDYRNALRIRPNHPIVSSNLENVAVRPTSRRLSKQRP